MWRGALSSSHVKSFDRRDLRREEGPGRWPGVSMHAGCDEAGGKQGAAWQQPCVINRCSSSRWAGDGTVHRPTPGSSHHPSASMTA